MKACVFSPLHRRIGAAIRECRTALGLTQGDLAARLDCRIAYVGPVERGQQNIRISTLDLFFAALNAEPSKVLRLFEMVPADRPAGIALLETLAKTLGLPAPHFTPVKGSSLNQGKAYDKAHDVLNRTEYRIMEACLASPRRAPDLVKSLGYTSRTGNFKRGLNRLIHMELLELIIPDRPRSKNQKYILTDKGKAWLVASHI